MVFNPEPIKGHEIIKDIVDIALPQAESKNIHVHYCPCTEEWWFNVDYDHIRTAFMNIISNAVKYTPEGGELKISTTVNGGLANLIVKDSGIGIAKEIVPYLRPFFPGQRKSDPPHYRLGSGAVPGKRGG